MNLEAEMTRKKISKNMIAKILNISYGTVCAKMNGNSTFDVVEAFKIRDYVDPELQIDYLFATDEQTKSA